MLGTSQFLTSMIREGCRLHCSEYPTPCFSKIIDLLISTPKLVVKVTEELLCNNCIVDHDFPPYRVNPLTVAGGKKLRLVMDLRNGNAFVSKVKFKYEDLRSLSQVLEENHWFFTWHLKAGYHHVDIFADHQKDFRGKLKTTVLLVSRTSSPPLLRVPSKERSSGCPAS